MTESQTATKQSEAHRDRDQVLTVEGLFKTFYTGFLPYQWAAELASHAGALGRFARRVEAVRNLSFEVRAGEIFGLLGPNGAGKTTTLKMIVGLLRPDRGSIRIFGQDNRKPSSRKDVGFLPENPYFYDYLRPQEFLDLAARLTGLNASERKKRIPELLDMVGLSHATDRPLRKFSKGMLQRVGLAQALISDPKFVILDEPMTGLDPVGRKEIRDLIAGLADQGKTVLFSSHILSDVEMLCTRVAILAQGRLRRTGLLDDLVGTQMGETEILIEGLGDLAGELQPDASLVKQSGNRGLVVLPEGKDPTPLLRRAIEAGGRILSVTPRRKSLEEIFMAQTKGARTGDAPDSDKETPDRQDAQRAQDDTNGRPDEAGERPSEGTDHDA